MGKSDYTVVLGYAGSLLSISVETPCVPPKDPDHPLDP